MDEKTRLYLDKESQEKYGLYSLSCPHCRFSAFCSEFSSRRKDGCIVFSLLEAGEARVKLVKGKEPQIVLKRTPFLTSGEKRYMILDPANIKRPAAKRKGIFPRPRIMWKSTEHAPSSCPGCLSTDIFRFTVKTCQGDGDDSWLCNSCGSHIVREGD